jgi:hypothetical protein
MLVRILALALATAGLMVPVSAPASATPDNYTPRIGPTFNSAVGDAGARRAIFRKLMRTVNSTPRRSNINMFTWNFLTGDGADALIRAKRRGVRVRVLMDDINLEDNGPWRRLRRELKQGNRKKPAKRRSWARVCQGTCRAGGGAAHSKFFMFSEAGKARRVVIQGSANFTQAASNNQWNDIYTHRGNRNVWGFYSRVFNEASRDKRARKPYLARSFKKFRLIHFPNVGKVPDPVMQMLNRVKCRGATNTRHGRTVIRIAPDVMRNKRGMRLGRKVRSLWNDGCDVKIGYTVMGIDVGRMLRSSGGRGPVPMTHMVQDFNGDGQFDNYFHMKSMTITGHYGRDRSNNVLLNGSANWSGLGKISDENLGIYHAKKRVLRYKKHIEYWYGWFARRSARTTSTSFGRQAVADGRMTEDGLLFGTAPVNGVDPYANVEMD